MKKLLGEEVKAATAAQIKKVVEGEGSKSQKMKALFDMGLDVKEIQQLMGVRYNFVYNVVSNYCNMNGIAVESAEKASKKDAILDLHKAGKSNKEIAITLKTNYNYVFNTVKQYKKDHPEISTPEVQAANE